MTQYTRDAKFVDVNRIVYPGGNKLTTLRIMRDRFVIKKEKMLKTETVFPIFYNFVKYENYFFTF